MHHVQNRAERQLSFSLLDETMICEAELILHIDKRDKQSKISPFSPFQVRLQQSLISGFKKAKKEVIHLFMEQVFDYPTENLEFCDLLYVKALLFTLFHNGYTA